LCKRVIVIHRGRLLYDGALAGLAERMAPYKLIRVTLNTVGTIDVRWFGTWF
jgi:ABC-2 type transport system ATP-binding protein